jgi:hypothetical protein
MNAVITTALYYLVPMTTNYATLDRCHPLLMVRMMRMIHPQMHHQVMLPHHDQDLLSYHQQSLPVWHLGLHPRYFCIQSFCSGPWPKHM